MGVRALALHAGGMALACAACAESGGEATLGIAERDSANVGIVEISGGLELLPERRLGDAPVITISGSAEPYFSNIGEVEWLSDGRIVVEDDQHDAVYLFAGDGAYVRRLADKGDGPGQFQNLTELTRVAGDSLLAYDRTHSRVTVLHPDVGFVRSVRIGEQFGARPVDVFALGGDRLGVQVTESAPFEPSAEPRRRPIEGRLFLADAEASPILGPIHFASTFGVVSGRIMAGHPYAPRPLVTAGAGVLAHGSGERYDLTIRDADFDVVRIVRWHDRAGPIPPQELDSLRRERERWLQERAAEATPQAMAVSRQIAEAELAPELLPERRPVLAWRSYLDERGRLWLADFEPGGADTHASWHVLDADARPAFRLTLPHESTLAAVRDDHVMIIVRDDMDVESLEVYALEG